jgi:phospholipid/cholesterol/gamma-HCH transport system permease protein
LLILAFCRKIGRKVLFFFSEIGNLSILLFRVFESTPYVLKHRHLLMDQMMKIGVQSLPLITVMSMFTGAVSSWQASYQFNMIAGFSTVDFLGAGVSAAILIELAPVLTGIVIAGRSGASIAAELGTMKVTEQIDALETLSIDPVKYLAAPRFAAGWIMLPVLVVYSDMISHVGAYGVAYLLLGISTAKFFGSVQKHFLIYNVVSGIIKAVVFGGGTALIGCSIGFRTEGGAEGVGLSTIKAFVYSSAFILIMDYVLATILF